MVLQAYSKVIGALRIKMALATHLYMLVMRVTHLVITLYGIENTLAPFELIMSMIFSMHPGFYITCFIYSNIIRTALTISSPEGKGFINNIYLDLRQRIGRYYLSLPAM
jgi:hypothetical protein